MGGTPLTALQIVGWPRETLSLDLLGDVLEGGSAVLEEAGCTLVGGHTIDDMEPKYGMAVTGVVHPDEIVTNAGARPTDVLVLTKPIGSGITATAIKREMATATQRDAAVSMMVSLNAGASRAMRRVGVNAATDVTGFGLLGHLGEIIRASGVSASVSRDDVPILEGVVELALAGVVPDGTRRNLAAVRRFTDFTDTTDALGLVLADAQTSGGLLMAVSRELRAALLQALTEEGVTGTVIGEIAERQFAEGPSGRVTIV